MSTDRTDLLTVRVLADRITKALCWLPENKTRAQAESALAELCVRLWVAAKEEDVP